MRRLGSARHIRKVRFGVLGIACVLIASLAGLTVVPGASAASPTAPTGITATASTDNGDLGGAIPAVLAAAGDPITLTVTLQPADAAFNNDTKLDLTASGLNTSGALSPASVIMPGGANSASFTVSYNAVDNGVTITVAVAKKGGKPSGVTPGTTNAFDVLKTLMTFANNPGLANGLGVGDANCTQATIESECGIVFLSHGVKPGTSGALSLGACTPTTLGCTRGSQVVQFIADLTTETDTEPARPLYTPDDPALLVFRCAKELCKGKGIGSYTIKVSFAASGPLDLVSAPCVSKGVALDADGNTFCTDYVQSHRDNAGDALLYFLFTHDMRGST